MLAPQDDYYDDDEEEDEEEEDANDDEEEMSRLVGRDGYLLPFATNEFHMHKEAQLHRLHHQETGINEDLIDDYRDNENLFFRPPRECPGWLPGGRHLGQPDAKEAIKELQAREDAKARKARQSMRKQASVDAKKQADRRSKFGAGRTLMRFDDTVTTVRAERAVKTEQNLDLGAQGKKAPTRMESMHHSLNKIQKDTELYTKRRPKMQDDERDLIHTRLLAIHDVMSWQPEGGFHIAEALHSTGIRR